jgi:hypothetical protein
MFEQVRSKFGALDVLVNCAGIGEVAGMDRDEMSRRAEQLIGAGWYEDEYVKFGYDCLHPSGMGTRHDQRGGNRRFSSGAWGGWPPHGAAQCTVHMYFPLDVLPP